MRSGALYLFGNKGPELRLELKNNSGSLTLVTAQFQRASELVSDHLAYAKAETVAISVHPPVFLAR